MQKKIQYDYKNTKNKSKPPADRFSPSPVREFLIETVETSPYEAAHAPHQYKQPQLPNRKVSLPRLQLIELPEAEHLVQVLKIVGKGDVIFFLF